MLTKQLIRWRSLPKGGEYSMILCYMKKGELKISMLRRSPSPLGCKMVPSTKGNWTPRAGVSRRPSWWCHYENALFLTSPWWFSCENIRFLTSPWWFSYENIWFVDIAMMIFLWKHMAFTSPWCFHMKTYDFWHRHDDFHMKTYGFWHRHDDFPMKAYGF